jgi:hypothetical protein
MNTDTEALVLLFVTSNKMKQKTYQIEIERVIFLHITFNTVCHIDISLVLIRE